MVFTFFFEGGGGWKRKKRYEEHEISPLLGLESKAQASSLEASEDMSLLPPCFHLLQLPYLLETGKYLSLLNSEA